MRRFAFNQAEKKSVCIVHAVCATLVISAVCFTPARSAEIQWNGGSSQFWHNEFNWDPFGFPFSIRRIPTDFDTANLLTPAGDDVFLGGSTKGTFYFMVKSRMSPFRSPALR